MIKKSDFASEELKHIKVSDSFSIEFGQKKGLIVYGANGVGKTSISKYIQLNNDSCEILDLDYTRKNRFVKDFGTSVEINTVVDKIEILKSKLAKIDVVNMSASFKKFGITNPASSKGVSSEFNKLRLKTNKWKNEDQIDYKIETSKQDISKMHKLFKDDANAILANIASIKEISSKKDEYYNYKKQLKKQLLESVESIYDLESLDLDECPICGSKLESLRETVLQKKEEYQGLKSAVTASIFKKHNEDEFSDTCNQISSLTDQMILDYIITEGNPERKENINTQIAEFNEIKREIELNQELASTNYEALKKIKESAEEYIKSRYPSFNSIDLDDANYSVKVNFNIEVSKLSTGQLNLILFITDLYKFQGSSKDVLVMDDPLSSFDLCNQYKIVFEIVEKVVGDINKKYLIFTHNVEMLNIARNQTQNNAIGYHILDVLNEELLISESLEIEEAFFGLKAFKKLQNPYIDFMIKRELDITAPENKLFHYHGDFTCEGLSNQFLIQKIKNYDSTKLNFSSFEELLEFKILILVALRVYIEYMLYNAVDDKDLFENKFDQKPLGYKILKYTGNNDLKELIKTAYPKLSRRSLMNKKVMLNQHSHYQGQIAPLNYAINITIDDLNREVNEIIDMFIS